MEDLFCQGRAFVITFDLTSICHKFFFFNIYFKIRMTFSPMLTSTEVINSLQDSPVFIYC